MQRSFLLSLVLIYLLTWKCEADKQTQMKRMQLLRRVQPSAKGTERIVGRVQTGFGSAHSSRTEGNLQADEAVPVYDSTGVVQGKRVEGWDIVQRRKESGQTGLYRQPNMLKDEGARSRTRARVTRMPNSAGSPNLLASFAGKNRVLVITAPHDSDGYYRMMMSLLKPDVYCELAERHVHQIVMFHQEGEMGGKVRRITTEGKVMEEPLDTALIPRLMSFLKLEKGK